MSAISFKTLIPARFLTIIANFIILLLALMTRSSNVNASLPLEVEYGDYDKYDYELKVALSVGVLFVCVEFFGFISGLSMFKPNVCLFSTFLHFLGCLLLCQWYVNGWPVYMIWFILVPCVLVPSVTEILVMLRALFTSTLDL